MFDHSLEVAENELDGRIISAVEVQAVDGPPHRVPKGFRVAQSKSLHRVGGSILNRICVKLTSSPTRTSSWVEESSQWMRLGSDVMTSGLNCSLNVEAMAAAFGVTRNL